MGLCASSPTTTETQPDSRFHGSGKSTTIRIVRMDGKVEEHERPVRAGSVIYHAGNRDVFLCSSEHLAIGSCPPWVQDDEELQLGHMYFLLPLSRAHSPLSLADLCDLAIKARSALGDVGPQRSYSGE